MSNFQRVPLKRWGILFLWGALLAQTATARVIRSEAWTGVPFGVATVTIAVPSGRDPLYPPDDDRLRVSAGGAPVFYPAVARAPLRGVVRRFLRIERPLQVTLYFLFRGAAPRDVVVYAPEPHTVRLVPRIDPRAHGRVLQAWWQEFYGAWLGRRRSDHPRSLATYLTVNLGMRLGVELPQTLGQPPPPRLRTGLELLAGNEGMRDAVLREMLLAPADPPGAANRPLPPAWEPKLVAPQVPEGVATEAIAAHVPEECFYVRFGSYTNYAWFRDLTRKWGGELGNMLARPVMDYGSAATLEYQLAVKEGALSAVLGPAVISDAAMIGLDTLFHDGAALGVLFEARNGFLLRKDIQRQLRAAADGDEAAELQSIQIEGREALALRTPDGRRRSFYVEDGAYHLVTTSRTLARRFLQAGAGQRALADNGQFQAARAAIPVEDAATFVFVSPAVLRNLASPRSLIETERRIRSRAEMQVLPWAWLTARSEGSPAGSVDDLVQAGLLPESFGHRSDGSQLVIDGWPTRLDDVAAWQARLRDSVRGAAGKFLPVADVQVDAVTERERAFYRRWSAALNDKLATLGAIYLAVHRGPVTEQGLEPLRLQAKVDPFDVSRQQLLLTLLGEPTYETLAPLSEDLISFHFVSGSGGLLGLGAHGSNNHLFGGLRDAAVPYTVEAGAVQFQNRPFPIPRGYLGAWPRSGILGRLFGVDVEAAQPDPDGYQPLSGNIGWSRQFERFLVLSLNREVLREVTPRLRIVAAPNRAQLRLRVEDLRGTEFSRTIAALVYQTAQRGSERGASLINSLAAQLHVPPDKCRELAEAIWGAKFTCPLDGVYQLVEVRNGTPLWTSSALARGGNQFFLQDVPSDFEPPFLTWHRGLLAALRLENNRLHLDAELVVEGIAEKKGVRRKKVVSGEEVEAVEIEE